MEVFNTLTLFQFLFLEESIVFLSCLPHPFSFTYLGVSQKSLWFSEHFSHLITFLNEQVQPVAGWAGGGEGEG